MFIREIRVLCPNNLTFSKNARVLLQLNNRFLKARSLRRASFLAVRRLMSEEERKRLKRALLKTVAKRVSLTYQVAMGRRRPQRGVDVMAWLRGEVRF